MHCTAAMLLGYAAAQERIKTAFGDTGSGGVTGGSLAQKPSTGGAFMSGMGTGLAKGGIKPITSKPPAPTVPAPQQAVQQPQQQPNQWFNSASEAYDQHANALQEQGKQWTDPDNQGGVSGWLNTGESGWNVLKPWKWDWGSGGQNADLQGAKDNAMQSQQLFNNFMANPQASLAGFNSSPLGALGIAAMLPGGMQSIKNIIGDPAQLGQAAGSTSSEEPGLLSRMWDTTSSAFGHAGGLVRGALSTGVGGLGYLAGKGTELVGDGLKHVGMGDNNIVQNLGQSVANDSAQWVQGGAKDIMGNTVGLAGNVMDAVPFADGAAKGLLGAAKQIGTNNLGATQDDIANRAAQGAGGSVIAPLARISAAVGNAAAEAIPGTAAGGGAAGSKLLARGGQMAANGSRIAGRLTQGAGHVANTAGQMLTGAATPDVKLRKQLALSAGLKLMPGEAQ